MRKGYDLCPRCGAEKRDVSVTCWDCKPSRRVGRIELREDSRGRFYAVTTARGVEFFVDEMDYDLVRETAWTFCSGYIVRDTADGRLVLHTILAGSPDFEEVDHVDCNPLNCRRYNLRPCTHATNSRNKRKRATKSSSKFKGVNWSKQRARWQARITVNYKTVQVGQFATEEEAAKAYDDAALKYHGEFARLNFAEEAGNA